MRAIYKYEIPWANKEFSLMLPAGSTVLSIQAQRNNVPVLWVVVNLDGIVQIRNFLVITTGQKFDNNMAAYNFIGTCQLDNGSFVIHVFEERVE